MPSLLCMQISIMSSSLSSSLVDMNSPRPTSSGFEVMLPTVLKHYEAGKEEENENENENVVRFSFCLLYTSPSPRDRTRSRMPSSA